MLHNALLQHICRPTDACGAEGIGRTSLMMQGERLASELAAPQRVSPTIHPYAGKCSPLYVFLLTLRLLLAGLAHAADVHLTADPVSPIDLQPDTGAYSQPS
jgi:hypothetical protein